MLKVDLIKIKKQFLPRNWFILIFLFLSSVALQAQKELVNGTIVTLQGETLTVKIKPASEDKLAKGISVYNDTTEEYKKYSTKDISYFKYENDEYYAKTESHESKLVFMKKEIDGPATLYTHTYKVDKGNDKVEVVDYYVEKKESGKFKLMNKKTFKTEMADFYSDNEALAEKIKGAYYTYDEKEATVEEYNDWVAQGKPGKTWTKEDGNYTQNNDNNNNNNNNNRNNYNNNNNDWKQMPYDGSKFALEFPIMANYSMVYSDQLVTAVGVKNTSGGFGYNVGVGLRWQLSKTLFWRNGFNVRMKRFNSTYMAQDTSGNQYQVEEKGNLHYFGMYTMLNLEFGNFILGGGFDISFGNVYRADYVIKDGSGSTIYNETNQPESIIADKNGKNNFNAQFDMNMMIGYKIRLAKGALNLKPVFQYSVPLVSMFDVQISGIGPPSYYNGTGVRGFTINLGLIIDIGFPPKPKAKSLLED